jgi:hypothetical protein
MTANWDQFRSVQGVRQFPDDVVLDFGAGPRTYRPMTKVLDLRRRSDGQGAVPADGPVEWSQLSQLPDLLTVEYDGPARGIVEALATRPGVRFLYWWDAEGDIDLRPTGVRSLRIGGRQLESVAVNERLDRLQLRQAPTTVRIEAADDGYGLSLQLFHYAADAVVPAGLHRIRDLWLRVGGEVSASVLAGLTDLETLTLDFDEPPGSLTDIAELGRHSQLRELKIHNAYSLIVADLPELPALRSIEIGGTRTSTATAAQDRYRNTPVTVDVCRVKTDEWLAAHMDNPFRDWIEDGEEFASAACEAYDRARSLVEAITPTNPNRLALAESALRGLVSDLNAISEHLGEIDTLYRDQAGEAFHGLARMVALPEELERHWFDEGRQF